MKCDLSYLRKISFWVSYVADSGLISVIKASKNSPKFALQSYLNYLMMLRAHLHNIAAPECLPLHGACFQRMFSFQQCSAIKRDVARTRQGRPRPMPSADDKGETSSHKN